jgi:hypothetical protein
MIARLLMHTLRYIAYLLGMCEQERHQFPHSGFAVIPRKSNAPFQKATNSIHSRKGYSNCHFSFVIGFQFCPPNRGNETWKYGLLVQAAMHDSSMAAAKEPLYQRKFVNGHLQDGDGM